MRIKDLNQKHDSLYYAKEFERYQALYQGGRLFHSQIKNFLTKNALEDEFMYQRRAKEACFQSYINSIVNQFASQLFSSPFTIRTEPETSDDFYTAVFKEDCNLNGSDLQTFMRHAFTTSLVKGCAWIVAELPDDGNPPPENLLDQKERGLDRAWICSIEPENVFDWEYDSFGQFKWIITYSRQLRRDDPRLKRETMVETWKIYDQLEVETFQIAYDLTKRPNQDQEVPSLGKRPHGFTRVPLVRLELPEGLWLVDRLADAQIEHFQMNNALGWAMRRACYPTAVYKTDSDDGALVASSDGFAIKIGEKESFGWEGPPVDAFEIIAARVNTFKDEIHRLSLQMSLAVDNTPGTMKRSGDSKAMDAQATEICLHAYADVIKASIEEIFELISDARGDFDLTFAIGGMDQFSVLDAEAVVNSAKVAKELGIPSETFAKELNAKVADVLLGSVSETVKEQIRQEILSAKVDLAPKSEPQEVLDESNNQEDSQ